MTEPSSGAAASKDFAFEQIAEALKADILSGEYAVGDSLPSEMKKPRPMASFSEFHSFAQWAWKAGRQPGGLVVSMQWQIADALDE
ncbi:hypothetical protein CJ199_11965, partial [Brevibacterium paucivorans]